MNKRNSNMMDQAEHDRRDETEPERVPEKDPDEWVTGDEPMTGPQASYLKTLAHEAHEEFKATLSKAEASKEIERLQAKTGRGQS